MWFDTWYAAQVTLLQDVAALDHPGHLIREQRTSLGWSQDRLAELCDVTQADISRIENGRLDARWSTIQRIMSVLADPNNVRQRSLANGGIVSEPRSRRSGQRVWRPSGSTLPISNA
jgi:transcriptional regulator with XRE-family HTH domain